MPVKVLMVKALLLLCDNLYTKPEYLYAGSVVSCVTEYIGFYLSHLQWYMLWLSAILIWFLAFLQLFLSRNAYRKAVWWSIFKMILKMLVLLWYWCSQELSDVVYRSSSIVWIHLKQLIFWWQQTSTITISLETLMIFTLCTTSFGKTLYYRVYKRYISDIFFFSNGNHTRVCYFDIGNNWKRSFWP